MNAASILACYPHKEPLHHLPSMHSNVLFAQLNEKSAQISAKYEICSRDFLVKVCSKEERAKLAEKKVILRSHVIDVQTVLKTLAQATAIGAGIGFVLGGATEVGCFITLKTPLIGKITMEGTAIGAGLGATVGVVIGLRRGAKEGEIQIKTSSQFRKWKEGLAKEQYDLFLNSLKNQSKMRFNFGNFICPISQDIPVIPVVAPNGVTYDKESIERYLEKTWSEIQDYKDLGLTDEQIKLKLVTIWPLRCEPFKKEDLIYSAQFANDAIEKLKDLRDNLEVDPEEDPIAIDGLSKLLDHYKNTYKQVTGEVELQLMKELIQFGATDHQLRVILEAFKKPCRKNEKKNNA